MCCDGSLFDRGKAHPEDLPNLARQGVPLREDKVVLAFALGCTLLEGTACGIYADRFTTCRTFRCPRPRRVQAGEIDLAVALAQIGTARRMLARIEPGSRSLDRRRRSRVTTTQAVSDPVERMATAREHVALLALERSCASISTT